MFSYQNAQHLGSALIFSSGNKPKRLCPFITVTHWSIAMVRGFPGNGLQNDLVYKGQVETLERCRPLQIVGDNFSKQGTSIEGSSWAATR